MLEKFENFEIENKDKNSICGGSSGQPGGGLSFLVREQSSLGSNTPLYIVDGVQVISSE